MQTQNASAMTYKKSGPSGQAVAQPWRSLTHIQIRNIHFLQSEALQSTTACPNWPHRVLHKYYKTQQSHISPFQTLQKLQTSLGVTESVNNQHLFFIRAPQLCLQGCARSCGAQTDRQTDTELATPAHTTHQGSAAFTSTQHWLCKTYPAEVWAQESFPPFSQVFTTPERSEQSSVHTLPVMLNPL